MWKGKVFGNDVYREQNCGKGGERDVGVWVRLWGGGGERGVGEVCDGRKGKAKCVCGCIRRDEAAGRREGSDIVCNICIAPCNTACLNTMFAVVVEVVVGRDMALFPFFSFPFSSTLIPSPSFSSLSIYTRANAPVRACFRVQWAGCFVGG